MATLSSLISGKKWAIVLLLSICGVTARLTAQNSCKPDIVGIWAEEQDALSALLSEMKVYKFYEGDKVEILQYNSEIEDFVLLGTGNYRVDNQSSPSKIIFSNLTVLIFQTEGSFAFPILTFEYSLLRWQGILGITTTIHKIISTFNFNVSGIPIISQPNETACWATVATMLYLWKNGKKTGSEKDIDETLEKHSWSMAKYFQIFGLGATPSMFQPFYTEDMGMTSYTKCSTTWYDLSKARCLPWPFTWDDEKLNYFTCKQCIKPIPSIQELQELLCKHGPLAWTYKSDSSHVVIVNGIKNDKTGYGAILSIIDPWGFDRKQTYEMPYDQFYNTIVETLNTDCDYYNIYYW